MVRVAAVYKSVCVCTGASLTCWQRSLEGKGPREATRNKYFLLRRTPSTQKGLPSPRYYAAACAQLREFRLERLDHRFGRRLVGIFISLPMATGWRNRVEGKR